MDRHELVICGQPQIAASYAPVVDPWSRQSIAEVAQASRAQVEMAIASAANAFVEFGRWPAYRRAELLTGIADGIATQGERLARLITAEAGKPIGQSRQEVARAVATFTIAAAESQRIGGDVIPMDTSPAGEDFIALTRRFAIGPISAISPFNFPLNLVAHKLAPALAAGCPMVLKPPVQTPLTPLLLAQIVADAGAPAGVFTVVPCEVEAAQPLITDHRLAMLSFTGSDTVGWHLKAIAEKKRVVLELGGNAAVIVAADMADELDQVAQRIAFGAFAYAGQICISVQQILVAESLYDRFVVALKAATLALVVGNPGDDHTVVGPVIDEAAAERIIRWVDEAVADGATLICGGSREGTLVQPTILTGVTPRQKVCCKEMFGPVVTVRPVTSTAEAVTRVNESTFGLQAGLFTGDIVDILDAHERLEVGGVIVGDIPTVRFDHTPYGGVKDSGLGREGVVHAIDEMTDPRLLLIRKRPL